MKQRDIFMIIISALFLMIPLLPLLEWLFFRKFKYSGVLLILIWLIQGLAFYVVSQVIFSGVGDLAYAGGGAMVLFIVAIAISAIVGASLYPVLAIVVCKPNYWKFKLTLILGAYFFIISIMVVPTLYKAYFNPNVSFFGLVLDKTNKPIPNAQITISNCYGRKKFTSNDKGIFNITAYCPSILRIDNIFNPNTNSYCLSSWISHGKVRKPTILYIGEQNGGNKYGVWNDYDKKNPFRFECVWNKPKNLIVNQKYLNSHRIIGDGREYTLDVSSNDKKSPLKEGSHNGQLRLKIFVEKLNDNGKHYERNGWIIIEPINGGVQITTDEASNIAPTVGYESKYYYKFDNVNFFEKKLYFHSNGKKEYGYLDLRVFIHESLKINVFYKVNMNGDRAVVFDYNSYWNGR